MAHGTEATASCAVLASSVHPFWTSDSRLSTPADDADGAGSDVSEDRPPAMGAFPLTETMTDPRVPVGSEVNMRHRPWTNPRRRANTLRDTHRKIDPCNRYSNDDRPG